MKLELNRKGVALGLVVGLLGGAAGGALATSGAKTPKAAKTTTATTPSAAVDAFLADVAGRLGVSVDKLKSALKGAASDRVDQLLKDGTITQAQADAMKQAIQNETVPFGLGMRGGFGMHGGFGLMHAGADVMATAATYLGLTQAQLLTQLGSGTSLADVAKAQGKSVSGLQDALVAAVQKAVDASTGLTDAQKAEIVSEFEAHVGDLVDGTRPAGGPGLGMMGGGRMMQGAPMMGGAWH